MIISLLYCLAMVPVDQVTEFCNTVVQDYLEAHAQDKGFQDDISSFLTYYEKTWLGVFVGKNRTRNDTVI
jgi:hypothetical protein